MEKHWNFYDWFGDCVWTAPYSPGDTKRGIMLWWDEWMENEEYKPDVHLVLLEDHDASEE